MDRAVIPGSRVRPDVVFPRLRIAVFVDGCFWHCCPTHGTVPKRNADWWVEKLERNRLRDRRVDDDLEAAGWIVVRVWEHEPSEQAAARIAKAIRAADQ